MDEKRHKGGIEARIVRYADLVPCYNAFIDTRTPGSEAKENFTIIGPGVSENPAQHVHIAEPHGFNIGGARQPPHCVNSQHSHETAEVFVVHSGRWRFTFGKNADDSAVEAGPGDVVSFPVRTFRGFTNIGEEPGFLWAVLGGDDPGRVTWAPRVFEMARDYGLVLLENGSLVDTVAGETIPDGARPMPPTTAAQVAAMRRMSQADANAVGVPARMVGPTGVGLGTFPGVTETPLVGPASPEEGLPAGPLGWSHGFHVRRLVLDAGATIPDHVREEAEVLFLQEGGVTIAVDGEAADLAPGDTITIPVGAARSVRGHEGATLFVVRGGDAPGAARFLG